MYDPKSILQMARGAFQERVDLEMAKVIDNILDPNTKPTQKRKLTLTIEFTPDDDRQNIGRQRCGKISACAYYARENNPLGCWG